MNWISQAVAAVTSISRATSAACECIDKIGLLNSENKVGAAENLSADTGKASSFLLSRIPPFNGSNYEMWSGMMKVWFLSQDLWNLVEEGYFEERLTPKGYRYVRKKDAIALLFIQQAIDKSVFPCIANAKKSKEAWDALQNKYQGNAEQPYSKKPADESVWSCAADATESKEANAKIQQVQPQAGNSVGGVNQPLKLLYVGNLHSDVSDKQLYDIFSNFGQVIAASVCRDLTSQHSLGFGYVSYGNPGDAARALEVLNFSPFINGKPIRIVYPHQDPPVLKSGARGICVMNLDKELDDKALKYTFSAFGNLVSCKVATNASGQSKGYGYIEYDCEKAALKAIEMVNGILLNGKEVFVRPFDIKQGAMAGMKNNLLMSFWETLNTVF